MSGDISLFDLVNLSIGTPDPGSVQFNALHTLLHALIKHLNIQDVRTEWFIERDPSRDLPAPPDAQAVPRDMPSPYHHMEGKLRDIERQMSALERLPSGTELLTRSASGSVNPVSDMWQFMQLRRKVQANEDGVSKVSVATQSKSVWACNWQLIVKMKVSMPMDHPTDPED